MSSVDVSISIDGHEITIGDDGLTRMSYTMKQCSLKSVSESINLDGNNVINFSYTFCVKK